MNYINLQKLTDEEIQWQTLALKVKAWCLNKIIALIVFMFMDCKGEEKLTQLKYGEVTLVFAVEVSHDS